jgi:predicted phosphodiesterase
MKLLMLGDTHGDTAWIRHAIHVAKNNGCEKIVQLGDFGFWPHFDDGVRFLDKVSRDVSNAGLELYWVDGNHENHDAIAEMVHESPQPYLAPVEHKPNIFYLPRGYGWKWDGVRFMALGGAYSVDGPYRTPGMSWWAGETIKDVDVLRATSAKNVDVMLTHDCPYGAAAIDPEGPEDRMKDRWPQSVANMKRIRMVCDELQPSVLFHGHHHRRYDDLLTVGNPPSVMRVRGLGREGDKEGSTYIFDTVMIRS